MFRRKAGLTLLEILVVIAVISILASLLIPGLSKARRKAYQIKCLSNLKQLGIAAHTYAAEYRSMPSTGGAGKEGLALLKAVYLPYDKVYLCPSSGNVVPYIDYYFADELSRNADTDSPLIVDEESNHDYPMNYNVLYVDVHVESHQSPPTGTPGIAPVD